MDVEYKTDDLRRLATDKDFSMGLPKQVATKFRHRVLFILAATNERALYAMQGSLDYKKLKGQESQRTMRLNDQYRIKLEVLNHEESKSILILDVGDFHD